MIVLITEAWEKSWLQRLRPGFTLPNCRHVTEAVTTKSLCSQWERWKPHWGSALVGSQFPPEGLKALLMREPTVTAFLTLVLQLSASSQPASEAPRLSAACRASQPLPIPIPMPAPHPKPSGSLQGLGQPHSCHSSAAWSCPLWYAVIPINSSHADIQQVGNSL